ncbi:type II toxin-antitoxin system HigA family antitoxin [Klebsiella oxytoca]|uniref:type II toxin-antitoxin system HigA family antitoxin n=1 Tax=Klebsiella oxytoca TaxID=571 RepID=UPI0034D22889
MNISEAIKAANNQADIVPFLGENASQNDYEEALKLVEYLLENEPDSPLVDMLAPKIETYENIAPEFEEFNARIATGNSGVSLLRVLIKQHGLLLSDFENEIGKKSLVNRILSGERNLTPDHMRALAKRFGVPVAMFVE